jgi:hypothetical protein
MNEAYTIIDPYFEKSIGYCLLSLLSASPSIIIISVKNYLKYSKT